MIILWVKYLFYVMRVQHTSYVEHSNVPDTLHDVSGWIFLKLFCIFLFVLLL